MKKYSLVNYIVGSVILIIAFTILFSKSKSGFRGGGGHGSMGGSMGGGHGDHGGGGRIGGRGGRGWGYGGGGWGWNDGSAVGWPYEYTTVIVNQGSGAGCLQDFECASNQCNNGTCE